MKDWGGTKDDRMMDYSQGIPGSKFGTKFTTSSYTNSAQ